MRTDPSIPVENQEAAAAFLRTIDDPAVRNLVDFALTEAHFRFIRKAGQSEEDWSSSLPLGRFDMLFYARVLADLFARKHVVSALLQGKSLDEATA